MANRSDDLFQDSLFCTKIIIIKGLAVFENKRVNPFILLFIFGIAFHKDMIERLPIINKLLASKVRQVLEQNKAERHIRGGEATRKKYKESKEIDGN